MTTTDHSPLLTGSYDSLFVVISLLIATLASYAALDLAGRVRSTEGSTRYSWLTGGAIVMGLGIWSMHFVGMLAFRLPMPIAYDLPRMILSVAVAIGASLLALIVVSRATLRPATLLVSGALMGSAIAGMHYIGMASMRVGATLTYNSPIVGLSIVIAIVASLAALALAFSFRSDLSARGRLLKVLSAVVMGIAIAGMHYTAMAGARFSPQQLIERPTGHVLATGGLGVAVVAVTLAILGLALVGAVIDRSIQSKVEFARQLTAINAELKHSLEDAQRARRQLTAKWLEGVAETTTALAHEVNNPLTALMMNVEHLEDADSDEAQESIAEIKRAAHRIADAIKRLTSANHRRSVAYLGQSRMLDLSPEEPD